jgi:hypothetical protein
MLNAAISNTMTWHATNESSEKVKTLCGVTAWTEIATTGDLIAAVIDYSQGIGGNQIIECAKCEKKMVA